MGIAYTRHRQDAAAWMPKSRLGIWSAALAGLALGGTVGLAVAFTVGLEPADGFTDNWLLTGVGVGILVAGAAALVTGIVAWVRFHDRAVTVFLAVALGVLMAALMLQQVAEGLGWLES